MAQSVAPDAPLVFVAPFDGTLTYQIKVTNVAEETATWFCQTLFDKATIVPSEGSLGAGESCHIAVSCNAMAHNLMPLNPDRIFVYSKLKDDPQVVVERRPIEYYNVQSRFCPLRYIEIALRLQMYGCFSG
ncbi:hypothetical protein PRIPAC_75177 [Pristionchus pacificus]|uniref:MSP domain-containing protein n=1 Tax=Pristionchus pacificus TaxID=54126 RepID=A0A2A6CFN7_PRIPA|nr:hypothetical protein PRIPAC_75177 [Pristionchus pacificus]|eukprot:PDM77022.1 MSP domain-containing protein [Pristionchus pacificus]